jgi:hypothetical protein
MEVFWRFRGDYCLCHQGDDIWVELPWRRDEFWAPPATSDHVQVCCRVIDLISVIIFGTWRPVCMTRPAAPGLESHFSSFLTDIKTITSAATCDRTLNNWLYWYVITLCPVVSNLGFEIISLSSRLTCWMSLPAGACGRNWFVTFMPCRAVIQLVSVQL